MPSIKHAGLAAAVLAAVAAAPSAAGAAEHITTATGAAPSEIAPAFAAFGNSLGPLNANNGTTVPGGRREINWDAVPDKFASPQLLPPDFFAVNSARGALLTGAPEFRISATQASGVAPRFGDISPAAAAAFQTFSPQRLFAAPGRTSLDVRFQVPGQPVKADISSFGAVFTDVDDPSASAIAAYDADGALIGRVTAPPRDGGLSFVGYTAPDGKRIATIRITTGTQALAPGAADGAQSDVVALDDFVYDEPAPAAARAPQPPADPAPAPSPPPAPPEGQHKAPDRTAPVLSRVRVQPRLLRLRLSEAADLRIDVTGDHVHRVIKRAGHRGANSVRLPRLAAGRYRLRIVARDHAGNTSHGIRRTVRIPR